jgi:hypothetical protein
LFLLGLTPISISHRAVFFIGGWFTGLAVLVIAFVVDEGVEKALDV